MVPVWLRGGQAVTLPPTRVQAKREFSDFGEPWSAASAGDVRRRPDPNPTGTAATLSGCGTQAAELPARLSGTHRPFVRLNRPRAAESGQELGNAVLAKPTRVRFQRTKRGERAVRVRGAGDFGPLRLGELALPSTRQRRSRRGRPSSFAQEFSRWLFSLAWPRR